MRAAVVGLRLFVTLAVLCAFAVIWLPEHRWQWLATGCVCLLIGGIISVALDDSKKKDATTNVVDINNGKGSGQ